MTNLGQGIHIVVNDTARFEGNGTTVGVGVGSNGVGYGVGGSYVEGNIITKKEIDFTAGKTINDVPQNKFKAMFKDLDLDKNGKLSQDEIDAYKNYVKLRNKFDKKDERAKAACAKSQLPALGAGLLSAVPVISKLSGMVCASSAGCLGLLFGTLGALGLGLLVGYGVYKLVSKIPFVEKNGKEADQLYKELEHDQAKIKKLDKQYKNIGYQFVG